MTQIVGCDKLLLHVYFCQCLFHWAQESYKSVKWCVGCEEMRRCYDAMLDLGCEVQARIRCEKRCEGWLRRMRCNDQSRSVEHPNMIICYVSFNNNLSTYFGERDKYLVCIFCLFGQRLVRTVIPFHRNTITSAAYDTALIRTCRVQTDTKPTKAAKQ